MASLYTNAVYVTLRALIESKEEGMGYWDILRVLCSNQDKCSNNPVWCPASTSNSVFENDLLKDGCIRTETDNSVQGKKKYHITEQGLKTYKTAKMFVFKNNR